MKKIKLLFSATLLCAVPAAVNAQMYNQGDIMLMQSTGGTHDSTECQSIGSNMYQFTISNSSITDTIFIIDQSSQSLISFEVNTMGQILG